MSTHIELFQHETVGLATQRPLPLNSNAALELNIRDPLGPRNEPRLTPSIDALVLLADLERAPPTLEHLGRREEADAEGVVDGRAGREAKDLEVRLGLEMVA